MFAHLNIINLHNQNFFYWIQVTSNLNNKKYSNFKNRLCGCVYKVLSYLRICHLLQVTSVCTPQHSAVQLSLDRYCVAKVSLVFLRNHWNVHLTKRKNKKKKHWKLLQVKTIQILEHHTFIQIFPQTLWKILKCQ